VAPLRPHEPAQVTTEIIDSADNAEDFHDRRLMPGTMAKIGIDGRLDGFTTSDQSLSQLGEIGTALGE
jgi:hypothetical protein